MKGSILSLALSICSAGALPSLKRRQVGSILDVPYEDIIALRDSVGGRLNAGLPTSQVCFPWYHNGRSMVENEPVASSPRRCRAIRNNDQNGTFIADQFGSYHNPNFGACMAKDQGCSMPLLRYSSVEDPVNATCWQGGVPNYYIEVQEVADIQKGIAFAKDHNIPLVVKNTGHDYQGRSSGPNSLAIWTHNYKPPMRFYENFQPESCSESVGAAVAYGSGTQFGEVQTFLHERGHMMVSGISTSVGASGGWLTGGGHGPFSATMGLGVDQVYQMTAVLPNSTVITANRCQNQDMFFALRGGGGNGFGVVTEVVYKAFPEMPIQDAELSFTFSDKNATLDVLLENAEQWNRDGWGHYIDVLKNRFNMDGTSLNLTRDEAMASLKPLLDFAYRQENVKFTLRTWPNFHSYLYGPLGQERGSTAIGTSFVVGSRIIPKEYFEGDQREILRGAIEREGYFICTISPANFQLPESDQPGGPGHAAVTPAFRNAYWFLMYRAEWDSGDPSQTSPDLMVSRINKNNEALQVLRDITPNGGAYFNEAHPYEPNEGEAFWGKENYERLLRIKREIDPENVLTCRQCVGWDESDERWGCYPRI